MVRGVEPKTLAIVATGAAAGFQGQSFTMAAVSFLGLMALAATLGRYVPWLFTNQGKGGGPVTGVVALAAGWYVARGIARRLESSGASE